MENKQINEEFVYIVTSECGICPHGIPDANYGCNIRIVTKDWRKAYDEFIKWVNNLDGHMKRNGYREKYPSGYMEGDLHKWVTWERHANEIEHTSVELERHKVI